MAERLGIPPEEFFELIHPAIAEDEWTRIAVDSILGLGAGWWQWALLTWAYTPCNCALQRFA